MLKIIHPASFQIIRREGNSWYFRQGKVFYRGANTPESIKDREQQYGLTKEKIVIELFRLSMGKEGYYLANLADKKYYYCGLELQDVKITLQYLGIGIADPIEN